MTKRTPALESFDAVELSQEVFAPILYLVEGIITEGLNVLAGRPKQGKSWLVLGIALAIAMGGPALGKLRTKRVEVLYCALEDSPRRLQNRLKMMLGNEPLPPGLHFTTSLNRLNQGGLQQIETWLVAHPNVKFLVIDTHARIMAPRRGNADTYQEDSAAGADLQALAQRHGLSLLLIMHSRKAEAADFVDEVLGSTGLTGSADTVMVLKRARGEADATLHVTGRDIVEEDYALKFHPEEGTWHLLGEARRHTLSEQRREIIEVVQAAGKPIGPKEVADSIGANLNSTRVTMQRMLAAGELTSPGHGQYACAFSAFVPLKGKSTESTQSTAHTKKTVSTERESRV